MIKTIKKKASWLKRKLLLNMPLIVSNQTIDELHTDSYYHQLNYS